MMKNNEGNEISSDDEDDDDTLVCVLCGAPWFPAHKNRCACGGFCTWGTAQGTPPLSWEVTPQGVRPRQPERGSGRSS
jgi:ribosomal protein L37E